MLLVLTWILVSGVRESAEHQQRHGRDQDRRHPDLRVRRGAGGQYDNWHPFAPNGFPGVLTGAAIVFFTYIGFDSVSTAAEECRRPQRDLPFGIIMTLVICALLYISVALVLTGIARYDTLNNAAPGGECAEGAGYNGIRQMGEHRRHCRDAVVAAGVPVRAGAHLVRDVARRAAAGDLLPGSTRFTRRRTSAPGSPGWWSGFRPASGISAPLPILANIGTLFAFIIVSLGVIVLRKTQPDRPRGFRVPLVPLAADDFDRLLPGTDDGACRWKPGYASSSGC